jgi:hypothetical protein
MKATMLSLLLAGAAVLVAGPYSGAGAKKSDSAAKLFNGKDLTGWVYSGMKGKTVDGMTETPDARIEVKDGAIYIKEKDKDGKGGIKDLYTAKSFDKDFVLKMQFKAGLKADSGVYIRGPQLQIRDFIRRGEQKHLKNFKNDDWNDLEITVKGTEATYVLNGEPLKGPDKMKIPAKGPIGVQAESGVFEFRNIVVKELP